ncbi:MAG: hypothetical protein A2017_07820 [Lentisphaerae bacterium GWF2_44_16]|nr:MAG: hypothetical protein A2017_07820 [Lentisphaerae bacterium GWF2_44_16]
MRKLRERDRKQESGQTLILSVLAMIILVFAIVFLFDLQNIIRIKIKAFNAVDSAALTAANWQKYSLNIIGELNIIKACTVLISDIQPVYTYPSNFIQVEDISNPDLARIYQELSDLRKSSDLLTEMQARVSFVGPLIGLGAAQLAAKNNGLNYNAEYGTVFSNHLARVINDGIYGDDVLNQYIPARTQDDLDAGRLAYSWRIPYITMLADILAYDEMGSTAKGIAVAPNTQYFGAPSLTSDPPDFIGYLTDRNIYAAITANYWCYIRDLLRMSYSSTNWWGEIQLLTDTTSFPEESEYLPINIDYTTGSSPYSSAQDDGVLATYASDKSYTPLRTDFDNQNPYIIDSDGNMVVNPADTDLKFNPLPYITWAIYSSNWYSYGDMSSTWDVYLYPQIKDEYRYYGAVSKMTARVSPVSLSGNWRKLSELGEDKSRSDLAGKYVGDAAPSSEGESGGVAFGGSDAYGTKINTYAARLKSAEKQMRTGLNDVVSSALAKPFGRLQTDSGTYLTPNSSRMVLPCFERAALIPVALEDPGGFDPFDYKWYAFLTEYLPTLGTTDSLDNMPGLMSSAYSAHWNSGWFAYYHAALLKLNDVSWRQQGINWLETNIGHQPIYGDPYNPTLITGYTPDDYNEDHCDDWTGTGPGPRAGPSVLH